MSEMNPNEARLFLIKNLKTKLIEIHYSIKKTKDPTELKTQIGIFCAYRMELNIYLTMEA